MKKLFLLTAALLLCLTPQAAQAEAAVLLVEAGSLQTIMEEGADAPLGVAGLARLPAILVLTEAVDAGALDPAALISISDRAARIPGPTAFVEPGEEIAASALLKAACMISAGDATMALGEHLYGSEERFLEAIQERLEALGITAALSDPLGTECELSAADLSILGRALMESPCFSAHAGMTLESITHADGRETELVSANRMLRSYAGCNGVATGSSAEDGYCGIFSAVRGDTALLAVVLGAENSKERFAAAVDMLDEAFLTIRTERLATEGEVLHEGIRVRGGAERSIPLIAKETVVLVREQDAGALTATPEIPEECEAPIAEGQVLGYIAYRTPDGAEAARVELIAQHAVEQIGFRDALRNVLLTFLRQ